MKIVVDFDLCESNAVCMQIAPDVFEVRDDDFLYVLNENPDESDRERMEECVQRCPKQAISIEDCSSRMAAQSIHIVGASLAGIRAAAALRRREIAGRIV